MLGYLKWKLGLRSIGPRAVLENEGIRVMQRSTTICNALLVLLAWIAIGQVAHAQQYAIHVDNSLPPGGLETGFDWATAFRSLDDALANQATTLPPLPIWVRATGSTNPYVPTIRTDPSDARSVAFQPNRDFARRLLGAFAGTETTEAPLGTSADTILDGDFDPNIQKPAYHVVYGDGVQNAPVIHIDGFRIINGNADGALREYTAGGGMYFIRSRAWIRNCEFFNNTATRAGGGFAMETSSLQYQNNGCEDNLCWIGNCLFEENSAAKGGALYARDYHEIVDLGQGGLAYALGTAVQNCEFRNNRAMDGGALNFEYPLSGPNHVPASLSLFGNIFDGNQAVRGGAICLHPNNGAQIVANTFSANVASGQGTCLFVRDPDEVYTTHPCETITTITGPEFRGNICWGNATLTNLIQSTAIIATNNDTQGAPLFGGGNISVDPLFIPGGFALSLGSPCIDVGALDTSRPQDFADLDDDMIHREPISIDILGQPRIAGVSTTQMDMGAIERQ